MISHYWITQKVNYIIDDVLLKNNSQTNLSYGYEVLWSDCGFMNDNTNSITPYGHPLTEKPGYSLIGVDYNKYIDVKKEQLTRNILQLLVVTRNVSNEKEKEKQ